MLAEADTEWDKRVAKLLQSCSVDACDTVFSAICDKLTQFCDAKHKPQPDYVCTLAFMWSKFLDKRGVTFECQVPSLEEKFVFVGKVDHVALDLMHGMDTENYYHGRACYENKLFFGEKANALLREYRLHRETAVGSYLLQEGHVSPEDVHKGARCALGYSEKRFATPTYYPHEVVQPEEADGFERVAHYVKNALDALSGSERKRLLAIFEDTHSYSLVASLLWAFTSSDGDPCKVRLGKLFIGICSNGTQDFAYDCTGFGTPKAGPRKVGRPSVGSLARGSRVYISPGPPIEGLDSLLEYKVGVIINRDAGAYLVSFKVEEIDMYLINPHVAKSCVVARVPRDRIIAEAVAASMYRSMFDSVMTLTASAVLAQDAWRQVFSSAQGDLGDRLQERLELMRALKNEVLSIEKCKRGCCSAPLRNCTLALAKLDETLHTTANAPLPEYAV